MLNLIRVPPKIASACAKRHRALLQLIGFLLALVLLLQQMAVLFLLGIHQALTEPSGKRCISPGFLAVANQTHANTPET